MPLSEKYTYKISKRIKKINNPEKQIMPLLEDVRGNVSLLRSDISNQRLDIVLKVIEKGEWILQNLNAPNKEAFDPVKEVELNYQIDLSEAQSLIQDYRRNSEGGCESCTNLKKHYIVNETYRFCKINEDEGSVKDLPDSRMSPTVEKYSKKGCNDIDRFFSKTIEQILKENN